MQQLKTLMRKVSNIFSRGLVQNVDDSKDTQQVQLSLYESESYNGVENMQPFGFGSVPLDGAEALVGFLGGNRDDGAVLAIIDKRYRPTDNTPGSSYLYDAIGSIIILNNDGTISITCNTSVTVNAPNVIINGNLQVNGSIKATEDITDHSVSGPKTMAAMRATYNTHTHIDFSTNPTSGPNNPM